MQWNLKWVIIGVVFMILVVVFGRDPGDEARERREEAAKDPNALVKAIEEHNAKRGGMPGLPGGAPGGWQAPPQGNSAAQPSGYPPYMMRKPVNPFRSNPQNQQLPAGQEPAENNGGGYYPPSPQSGFGIPDANTPFRLSADKVLRFRGSEVYALDASGRVKLLPDGAYRMENSALTMVVRGGRKIAVQ